MKTAKRIVCFLMTIATVLAGMSGTAEAVTKPKLNKKKVTLTITDKKAKPTATLKVKGTKVKAKWTSSKKSVATVKKGKVTAKKAGKTTITCKVGKKKLTCRVTVADKRTKDKEPEATPKATPSNSDQAPEDDKSIDYNVQIHGKLIKTEAIVMPISTTLPNGVETVVAKPIGGFSVYADGTCIHEFYDGYEYMYEYGCEIHQ